MRKIYVVWNFIFLTILFAIALNAFSKPPEVDPSRILLQYNNYIGREVSFTITSFGSLSTHPMAPAYLYIDEYAQLQPLFNSTMVERWISGGFNGTRHQNIILTGIVRPKKFGINVLLDVTDIQRTQ
jgi:hypothetical protein